MRNAASILLIIILVVLTPVVLLLTTVKSHLTTSTFLKAELSAHDLYGVALDQVDTQLQKVTFDKNIPITNSDLVTLAHEVFTHNWLQMNIEGTLDRAFAWFNAPNGTTLSLPIDLSQPKQAFASGIDTLLTSKIPTLPNCPKQHSAKDLCRTSKTDLAQVKTIMKNNGFDVAAIEAQLPATIDLANPTLPTITVNGKSISPNQNDLHNKVQPILDHLTQAKEQYHQFQQGFMFLWAIYILLILATVAVHIPNWSSVTRWAGILLVCISVIPLAISSASAGVLDTKVIPNIHFDASTPAAVTNVVPELLRDVQHAFFGPIMIVTLAMFVIGLGAIIGAHWVPSRAKKPAKV